MPPQDVLAEQCALGAMLLSKDAVADVSENLKGADFYRPAHEMIYDAVLDLFGRGEPADPVTVADVLGRRGELNRVGGAPYLHTLVATVPTAASAAYYARIVRDKAILRRLVEAGTKIATLGYAGEGGDVDEIVNLAQAEVYSVTDRQARDDYRPLSEVMQDTVTELEEMEARPEGMNGVPTGFRELDQLTNGLHPGQMIVIAARPAMGKALGLDTPLPTPTGWTTMGEVRVGDDLLDADGCPTRVVAATEVLTGRPCYEVVFDDGTTVVADALHQWRTDTRASRRGHGAAAVRTTQEIAGTLNHPAGTPRANHSVDTAAALVLPDADLPVDPYVLGVWLGAGHAAGARISTADPEIVMRLEGAGLPDHDTFTALLRRIGVLGDKHVPTAYLRASEAQRRALLAGLLDSDGTVTDRGSVQLAVTDPRLAESFRELVVSLGYRCGVTARRVAGRAEATSTCWIVSFTPSDDVFVLMRKQLVHKERRSVGTPRLRRRYVVQVRPVASVPVRCVEVDNDDHLYLATRSMVPTHNSTVGLDIARSAAIHNNMSTVIFSLEMSRSEISTRLISAEAGIKLQALRTGKLQDNDWQKIARVLGQTNDAPLFIDDSPNMTMPEIRAKCRRLKQQTDLKLVVLDYLQLMSSGKRVESRQQEVSEFSRALKLLAKELEVPVIAISQLNRGPEQRTDKKPQMSDLRESGAIEQDADMIMLLHREDAYDKDNRPGEADFIIAKHRNGPTDTITVVFQGHYSRFGDMAHG
ncbi:replicative DNA helicase [Aquipuribacter sp. MA13-6]|uniref:replicative DNA helicase n=1 Tax=unclassified Aquipuribacter TaxID=2635084 RepID=UPI003EEE92A4